MKTIEIEASGKKITHEIGRKTLVETLEVPFRDLRPIFSISQVATIFARKKGVIMNLGVIKMLISFDRVWLFNTDSEEVNEVIAPGLAKALKSDKQSLDFELSVIEFAFNYKLQKMKGTADDLEKATIRLLKRVEQEYDDRSLEKLLKLKKQLSRFEIILKENEAAALEVLEDDEDLQDLCITQKMKAEDEAMIDIEEVESIFESYTDQIERLSYHLGDLKENIDDTQEIIALKLQNRRNSIIRYDLLATLITAVFSFLAVITGLYGMNIRNHFEQSQSAFWLIVSGFILFFALFCFLVLGYLKRHKIL
jgi:magnesium transporter